MTPVVSYYTPCEWPPRSDQSACPPRSTILQQQFNRTGKVEHGSVALPAVMRSGSSGPETFNVGSMPSPQQQVMVGQMHRGHMPPLVRLPGDLPCSSLCCLWCPGSHTSLVIGCVCHPHSPYFLSESWLFSCAVPMPNSQCVFF